MQRRPAHLALLSMLLGCCFCSHNSAIADDSSFAAPLQDLPSDLRRTFSVVTELPYSLRLDDTWMGASGWAKPDGTGSLAPPIQLGFPFVDPVPVPAEVHIPTLEEGTHALWNSASLQWLSPAYDAKLEITNFSDRNVTNTLQADISRVYPGLYDPDLSKQIFRELLTYSIAPTLSPVSWLSFRLLSRREDVLWNTSLALQEVWKAPPTLRSDGLEGTLISLNDLLGLSENLQNVEIASVQTKRLLVPFSRSRALTARTEEDGCLSIEGDEAPPAKQDIVRHWYSESRMGSLYPWWSERVYFAPRDVLVIECIVRDPFRKNMFFTAYLDRQSFLPYLIASSPLQNGPGKLLISAFGLAVGDARKIPFLDFSIALEQPLLQHASTVDYYHHRFCPTDIAKGRTAQLDPSKLLTLK